MKRYINYWMMTVCFLILAACGTESELAQTIDKDNITVSSFPEFAGTSTRSAGTFDAGKTAWADGDEILVKLSFTNNTTATGVITYDGTAWNWTTPIPKETDVADVVAYYAPAYEWSNGTLALKSDKQAGTDEYLTYTTNDVTLSDGISIDFTGTRTYSRLRVVTEAGTEVSITCSGFTANDGSTTAATAIVTTADAKGNAYFYGMWSSMQISVSMDNISVLSKTITTASTPGHSYALEPAFMRYTINNTSTTEAVSIPFPTSGTTPAGITVDWGDGTNATVPSGTALASGDAFDHTYASTGDFTITIFSFQTDDTQQQIPEFNFYNNRNTTYNRNIVKSIDTPLLNTAVTFFYSCFNGCSNLTSIPAGLFDKNTAVTNFYSCFAKCSNLTSIPEGLFDKYTAVKNFGSCFANCSNLTSIPAGLFDKNTAVKDFSYCFYNCSNLTSIPAGLFAKNTAVTSFYYCFNGCSNLTSIPAGLFDKNTAVTDFNGCFYNCSNLTSIPAGLFAKNTAVTNFGSCFAMCSNLTSIPAGLFDKNTAVTNFGYCFYGCTRLKLNANIFIDGTTTSTSTSRFSQVTSIGFYGCFMNCGSSLQSEEGGIAPDLWNYTFKDGVVLNTTKCFYNVTNVENANAIPSAWKE